MYFKGQQLICKVFNHMFWSVSNRHGPKFLSQRYQGRDFKRKISSYCYSRYVTVKMFSTSSSACVVKEYKTLLSDSKKLCIDIPCDLKVKPIDSQSKDLQNVIVRVFRPEVCDFCIDFVDSEDIVTVFGRLSSITSPKKINDISLEIEIPFYHDVKVISEHGNVCISNLRSDNMSVQVTNGNINCKNIYCASMFFDCFNGNVNCEGILHGNTDIRIRNCGNVNGFNFQGGSLRVETKNGDISISSTYCDKSTFLATEGNLFLKNLHRRNFISVHKGNLVISGLDGSLAANLNEGNIKVQVTQLNEDSYMETKKGNAILSVEKEDLCLFNLSGKSITIKDNLKSIGEINHAGNCEVFKSIPNSNLNQPTMKVLCADGEVCLEKKSWVSSLIFATK